MFYLITNCQTVFQSGYTVMHPYQQCMSFTISSALGTVNCFSFLLFLLRRFNMYAVAVICISPMSKDLKHLFIYFFTFSLLENYWTIYSNLFFFHLYGTMWSHSVICDSLQPTRLLCPWDFTGKSNGVVCHFLLQQIFFKKLVCKSYWVVRVLDLFWIQNVFCKYFLPVCDLSFFIFLTVSFQGLLGFFKAFLKFRI